MKQAKQSFHTVNAAGEEVFVPVGKVFPDNHLFVSRDVTGELFEDLEVDDSPAPAKAAPAKAEPTPAPQAS